MLKKRFSTSRASSTMIDEDVDDETFLRKNSNSNAQKVDNDGPYGNATDTPSNLELPRPRYESLGDIYNKQKLEIQQRTLDSTRRSLSILHDTEEVGAATAEELYRQREQIETTNERLDEINENLHYSGKHIQGISSLFGSIKNYWSRKSSVEKNKEAESKSPRSVSLDATPRSRRQLKNALDRANTNVDADEHPALRLRGISSSSQGQSSTDSSTTESLIDRNFDEMVGSIARLKDMAQGLGQELDGQNHLLDEVIGKTEKADINIERQNKDLNRLLKK